MRNKIQHRVSIKIVRNKISIGFVVALVLQSIGWAGPSANSKKKEDCKQAARIDKHITPPVLIKRVDPQASDDVWKKIAVWSLVIIEVVITENGSISCPKIVKSSNPLLQEIVVNAIKQWKYKPALKDKKPIPVYLTVVWRAHPR